MSGSFGKKVPDEWHKNKKGARIGAPEFWERGVTAPPETRRSAPGRCLWLRFSAQFHSPTSTSQDTRNRNKVRTPNVEMKLKYLNVEVVVELGICTQPGGMFFRCTATGQKKKEGSRSAPGLSCRSVAKTSTQAGPARKIWLINT